MRGSDRLTVRNLCGMEKVDARGLAPFRRFVLVSDSISVYGTDRLTRKQQSIARDVLIDLVTPDAAVMIRDYRSAVEALRDGADVEALRFYSRIVGKDPLKCLRAEVPRRGGGYEVTIDRIYGQVAAHTPELGGLADDLYRLYQNTQAGRSNLLAVLDHAEQTMAPFSQCDR